VYDCGEEESFANVENWMRQIDENASPGVKRILVCNKCDVPDAERAVSKEKGEALAAKYGIPYFEASAKENLNVNEAFLKITRDILKELKGDEEDGKKLSLGGDGGSAGCGCG
jgi:Ras-related protein Rab-8A